MRLCEQWADIVALLETEISGVASVFKSLEPYASGIELKAYEDMLDAIVCAWVGMCGLEGRAKPFGDPHSAIWVPQLKQPSVRF